MASHLKMFVDKSLNEPLKRLKFPRTEIGDSSLITIFIQNTSEKWPVLEIKHNQTNKDITVQGIPQQLRGKESVPIKIKWTPSLETDNPLMEIIDITSELHIG